LKWNYPRTIPAKFGLIWFSGFREEDLNVILLKCEMIWKIRKKSKLNSEKIWKLWKKSKLNSEKIWKLWKKSKLKGEMIWKI
jgi:hypothetical protein